MKLLIASVGFLAVLGVVLARSPVDLQQSEIEAFQQRAFEGSINDAINAAVEKLKPYDPVHVDHLEDTFAGHDYMLHNLDIDGFSNVFASHIKLSGLITWTLELVLEAPKISASIEQWQASGETFYGDGAATVNIENLKLSLTARVNIFSLRVSKVKVTPSIGSASVQVSGVYDDEQLSQDLSDKATKFLNDTINNDKDLHKRLSEFIENLINSIVG